jgi:hypothetical protein
MEEASGSVTLVHVYPSLHNVLYRNYHQHRWENLRSRNGTNIFLDYEKLKYLVISWRPCRCAVFEICALGNWALWFVPELLVCQYITRLVQGQINSKDSAKGKFSWKGMFCSLSSRREHTVTVRCWCSQCRTLPDTADHSNVFHGRVQDIHTCLSWYCILCVWIL